MKFKIFLLKVAIAVSILLILVGIGLLIWLGIGQYNAQIALDGQYISWRIVSDISQWGFLGIPISIVGLGMLIFFKVDLDHRESSYK